MCATKIVMVCLFLFVFFDLSEGGNGWLCSKSRHRRPPYHRKPSTTTSTTTTMTTPTTPTTTDQIRCELSGPPRTCLQMNCPSDNQFPDFFCPGPFPCCQIDL
ncbi:hypothetical protein V1264_010342 [Littorina saxatilis]|uniref:Uncharacterized protein n=1 Tax=Littorina saxatilis TaxID=31220 RepID=A0AAN9APJ1_9CAEN